jgi:hypothetical protein
LLTKRARSNTTEETHRRRQIADPCHRKLLLVELDRVVTLHPGAADVPQFVKYARIAPRMKAIPVTLQGFAQQT